MPLRSRLPIAVYAPFALILLLRGQPAAAQVAQPAHSAEEHSARPGDPDAPARHRRSWEAEPVYSTTVTTPSAEVVHEEEFIGEYRQPRWTANRRFPTTRIYVAPPGTLNAEYWLQVKQPLNDADSIRYRTSYEAEFGLGHHLQLDLYLVTEQAGHEQPITLHEQKFELRWALADWGVIPGNPTLYGEYVMANASSPRFEVKLLLGDQAAPRWHWGVNLVWERDIRGSLTHEYAITGALAYAAIDEKLSLGIEAQVELVDVVNSRFNFAETEYLAGPTMAWRPVPPMRVLLVGLFGAGLEKQADGTQTVTPIFEPTLIAGWEF